MIPQRFRTPLACLFIGGVIGWLLPLASPLSPYQAQSLRGALLRESSVRYQFISPLLACDIGSEDAFPEFAPLKRKLADIIGTRTSAGDIQSASVYLRSLNGARWFDINDAETYAPASLLKIFVMMAYYKEANETDNPGLLQEQVTFDGSALPNSGSPDTVGGDIVPLTNGKLYTVDRLIDQMIIYSDNNAYATLLNTFDPQTLKALEAISSDLNIPLPITHSENSLNFMPVDAYAMVFRVLYGSTYLSERYSEKALKLLSQAKYTGGIAAGVPANLVVAHKYGIKAVPAPTADTPNELHDCGIVYYPDHPYLLCIMTKGLSLTAEQDTIKALSAGAYQWLDVFYKHISPTSSTPPTARQ